MKTILLIVFNVLLLVIGQIMFKKGLAQVGGFSLQNLSGVLLSPLIAGGLLLYVVATVVWFMVLSRADLSYAYPLQSTAYALGVLASWLILKEVIPPTRWIGVGVIMIGVTITAWR